MSLLLSDIKRKIRKRKLLTGQQELGSTTHVRIFENDNQRLMMVREREGFRSVAWVVHKLLEEKAKNLATVEAVMKGKVPIVLTGKPLSGKSHFVKHKLLPSLKDRPVLVVDSWDEYRELRNIGYDIYSLDFKNFCEHIRFIPNTQSRVAETEVENIFAHLDMKRVSMSKWIIIVEEAHAYKNIPAFTKFLYGSRHIVKKIVAVTPQTDAFQGLVTLRI